MSTSYILYLTLCLRPHVYVRVYACACLVNDIPRTQRERHYLLTLLSTCSFTPSWYFLTLSLNTFVPLHDCHPLMLTVSSPLILRCMPHLHPAIPERAGRWMCETIWRLISPFMVKFQGIYALTLVLSGTPVPWVMSDPKCKERKESQKHNLCSCEYSHSLSFIGWKRGYVLWFWTYWVAFMHP